MSTPDPEGMTLLAKVMGAAVAVGAPIVAGYKWIGGQLDKKADKSEVDRHRDYFVKVFDKIEEHAKSSQQNFVSIKDMIHQNHIDLIEKLETKQDKKRR